MVRFMRCTEQHIRVGLNDFSGLAGYHVSSCREDLPTYLLSRPLSSSIDLEPDIIEEVR